MDRNMRRKNSFVGAISIFRLRKLALGAEMRPLASGVSKLRPEKSLSTDAPKRGNYGAIFCTPERMCCSNKILASLGCDFRRARTQLRAALFGAGPTKPHTHTHNQ